MSFRQAVLATPDVATCYKTGLTALGTYSSKISVSNTSILNGSVDIDTCTSGLYPNENRWDYAFAYDGEVFFIEIHSAKSGEVRTVIKKFNWLKDWLTNKAPEINKLKSRNRSPFYWIQSNSYSIPITSPQYRIVAKTGIKPMLNSSHKCNFIFVQM